MGQENIQQTVDKVLEDIAAQRQEAMSRKDQTQDKGADSPKKNLRRLNIYKIYHKGGQRP